jgi:N-acetylmuramate 1-kinase
MPPIDPIVDPIIDPLKPAALPIAWTCATRQAHFTAWLTAVAPRHGIDTDSLAPASADASFRRYFRARCVGGRSVVVMDAPPPQEDVRPFVHVATLIQQAGLHAPAVLEAHIEHGFLLLADLGGAVYLQALQSATAAGADRLMRDACQALVSFQQRVPASALPPFDEALLARELALFPEWCVAREFGITWTAAQEAVWQRSCRLLIDNALAQPVVAVHADWMPRNLMVAEPNPGILDFQDAVAGPITYDLASLLRDAFISWDETQEIDWAVRWWDMARAADLPLGPVLGSDFGEFWRALEWMGLQRHLKVMGIFCRLKRRDGKAQYAADLPRFLNYATKVALRYRPLGPLLALLEPLAEQPLRTGYTF